MRKLVLSILILFVILSVVKADGMPFPHRYYPQEFETIQEKVQYAYVDINPDTSSEELALFLSINTLSSQTQNQTIIIPFETLPAYVSGKKTDSDTFLTDKGFDTVKYLAEKQSFYNATRQELSTLSLIQGLHLLSNAGGVVAGGFLLMGGTATGAASSMTKQYEGMEYIKSYKFEETTIDFWKAEKGETLSKFVNDTYGQEIPQELIDAVDKYGSHYIAILNMEVKPAVSNSTLDILKKCIPNTTEEMFGYVRLNPSVEVTPQYYPYNYYAEQDSSTSPYTKIAENFYLSALSELEQRPIQISNQSNITWSSNVTYNLNGYNDSISIPDIDVSGDITTNARVYVEAFSSSDDMVIISKSYYCSNGATAGRGWSPYMFSVTSNGKLRYSTYSTSDCTVGQNWDLYETNSQVISSGQWYNVTVVVENNNDHDLRTVNFYVNGIEVSSSQTANYDLRYTQDSSQRTTIGACFANGASCRNFNGKIEKITIYAGNQSNILDGCGTTYVKQTMVDFFSQIYAQTTKGLEMDFGIPLKDDNVYYPLGTGAYWKNPIKDTRIIVEIPKEKEVPLDAQLSAVDGKSRYYSWTFTDENPNFDIKGKISNASFFTKMSDNQKEFNANVYEDSVLYAFLWFMASIVVAWIISIFITHRLFEGSLWKYALVAAGTTILSSIFSLWLLTIVGAVMAGIIFEPEFNTRKAKIVATMNSIWIILMLVFFGITWLMRL